MAFKISDQFQGWIYNPTTARMELYALNQTLIAYFDQANGFTFNSTLDIPADTIQTADIADDAVTTAKIVDAAVTSGKMAEGLIQTAADELASAQVKALGGTPVTLVAAPGTDKAVVPLAINLVANYGGTNAWTESADDLSVGYASAGEIKEIESTGFIDQTNDEWRFITFEHAETFIPAENEALVLTNLDDEIAGNAANDNTLAYKVWYVIVDTDV